MSILDNLLGGNSGNGSEQSSNSNDFGSVIGTNPGFGLSLDDVLHSSDSSSSHSDNGDSSEDSTEFTGIGGLDVGFSAPTVVGVSSSSENSSMSESNGGGNGGLLNGLL